MRRAARPLGHAPDRRAAPRPLPRRAEELGAAADEFDCFYFVADWHALTTHYEERGVIEKNVYEMVTDWLAAGLDPDNATIFIQSRLPEHAELFSLLAMVTPLGWLERVPTYKDDRQAQGPDLATYGFLGYPLLQTADILIYKAACAGRRGPGARTSS